MDHFLASLIAAAAFCCTAVAVQSGLGLVALGFVPTDPPAAAAPILLAGGASVLAYRRARRAAPAD